VLTQKSWLGYLQTDIIGRIKHGYAQPEEAVRRIWEIVSLGTSR